MKVKVSEAKEQVLGYLVAEANGVPIYRSGKTLTRMDMDGNHYWQPSTDWAQGGLIIEREKIAIDWDHDCWNASTDSHPAYYSAETPLVAAMRCYVASQLGDEVEIPKELIK